MTICTFIIEGSRFIRIFMSLLCYFIGNNKLGRKREGLDGIQIAFLRLQVLTIALLLCCETYHYQSFRSSYSIALAT